MKANEIKNCIITKKRWGSHQGKEIYLFKLENERGAYVELSNYGATMVSVWVADKEGVLGNVILGYPALEGYLQDQCYLGSTIGRFANRIGGAKFQLDGKTYYLDANDNSNTNHGGSAGFNAKVFDYTLYDDRLELNLFSEDGEGGFPGNLEFNVTYSWNKNNELSIEYTAISDKPTVANFTNHAYFNLSSLKSKVFDHELTIKADSILKTDNAYIPTGEIIPAGTLSFNGNKISDRIVDKGYGLEGVNTYYLIKNTVADKSVPCCELYEPLSGRRLEVFTSYPGVQLYTGDHLSGNYKVKGTDTESLQPFHGLCLECQYHPDAPNHTNFPSTVLDVGQVYREYMMYKFSN